MIETCTDLYKRIYPFNGSIKGVCLMGEVKQFRSLFGYCSVKQSAKKLKAVVDHEVIKAFELFDDPRFFIDGEFSNRKWDQMSLPFQIRATGCIYFLSGCRTFSFPARNRLFPKLYLRDLDHIALWVKIKQFIAKDSTLFLAESSDMGLFKNSLSKN